ncbi:hypothetical protein THIOKS13320036 [Thiocapsa sp. KS1]|nr:hypothetical protein THIOKS13320036 [Thiocapsa sp. KS1]
MLVGAVCGGLGVGAGGSVSRPIGVWALVQGRFAGESAFPFSSAPEGAGEDGAVAQGEGAVTELMGEGEGGASDLPLAFVVIVGRFEGACLLIKGFDLEGVGASPRSEYLLLVFCRVVACLHVDDEGLHVADSPLQGNRAQGLVVALKGGAVGELPERDVILGEEGIEGGEAEGLVVALKKLAVLVHLGCAGLDARLELVYAREGGDGGREYGEQGKGGAEGVAHGALGSLGRVCASYHRGRVRGRGFVGAGYRLASVPQDIVFDSLCVRHIMCHQPTRGVPPSPRACMRISVFTALSRTRSIQDGDVSDPREARRLPGRKPKTTFQSPRNESYRF